MADPKKVTEDLDNAVINAFGNLRQVHQTTADQAAHAKARASADTANQAQADGYAQAFQQNLGTHKGSVRDLAIQRKKALEAKQ